MLTRQDQVEAHAEKIRARQAQQRRELLSFYSLSQIAARVLLIAAAVIWLRAYLIFIDPLSNVAQGWSPANVVALVLDTALAVVFAAGQALIPPICISVLVTNSPAQIVLNKLNLKIGSFWYLFAVTVGIVLSYQSFNLMYSFWASRPLFQSGQMDPLTFAITSMLLLVGFPSWSINQLTPSQWVDMMLLSRSALAIKHAIDTEDMAAKAMIVRVRSLLMADVMELTLEQRAANNAEVAGILAGTAKMFRRGLLQLAESQKALTGYQAQLGLLEDQKIVERMTAVGRLLTDTTHQIGYTADYADLMAQPDALPPPHTAALGTAADGRTITPTPAEAIAQRTLDAPEVGPRAAREAAASGDGNLSLDALRAMEQQFGAQLWMRRNVEEVCHVEKTTAVAMIAAWTTAGYVRKIDDPRHHYQIIGGGAR